MAEQYAQDSALFETDPFPEVCVCGGAGERSKEVHGDTDVSHKNAPVM